MRRIFWICLVAILLVHAQAYAEVTDRLGGQDSDLDYYWTVDSDGTLTGNSNAEISLGDVAVDQWTTVIRLPLADFFQTNGGVGNGVLSVAPLTEATSPNFDLQNGVVCLVWDDGDTSYAQTTFKVPQDYISGGIFKVFVDYNTGADNPEIYHQVYVNSDGTTWDAAVTQQGGTDPAGTAGTPELVTLEVTTDFDSLAANDVVTFAICRSDDEASTADLELYYVDFYYNE